MTSYIIKNNAIVAKLSSEHTSGESVLFSSLVVGEAINANREVNLVNAQTGTISNAAKWDAIYRNLPDSRLAQEVNPGEFQIL